MSISYSLHLSAKSHAVSNAGKLAGVSKHNLRKYESRSYDRNLIEVLAGSTSSITEDVKKLYHREFDEAVADYNKGKRSDRQIKDYFKKVSDSQNDVAAEIIIQLGDQDFWKDKSTEQKKRMSYIFRDQIEGLQEYCPNFKIVSAVIHYDEKSPHMHVVGVPIWEKYTRGLKKQVSKTKVFTKESLSILQDEMRLRADRGISLNENVFGEERIKEKEEGRNYDIPKKSLDKFSELHSRSKKLKDDIEGRKEEIRSLKQQISTQNETLRQIQTDIDTYTQQRDNLRSERKNIKYGIADLQKEKKALEAKLDGLKEDIAKATSKKNGFENEIEGLVHDWADVKKSNQELKQECDSLQSEIKDLTKQAKKMQIGIDAAKFKRKTYDETLFQLGPKHIVPISKDVVISQDNLDTANQKFADQAEEIANLHGRERFRKSLEDLYDDFLRDNDDLIRQQAEKLAEKQIAEANWHKSKAEGRAQNAEARAAEANERADLWEKEMDHALKLCNKAQAENKLLEWIPEEIKTEAKAKQQAHETAEKERKQQEKEQKYSFGYGNRQHSDLEL